ncbi:DHS-like NAD/FAD-binding domain-containing protein [Desarmillaria ectypa]|nr:DHS-like NAD/FAD-binding domain-containing protein [Desarmillaria ectypa]
MPPSSDYKKFSKVLSKAEHIIVVAGAGLSAASGIPIFRGAGGLWRKYNAMTLATPQAFKRDPSLVWQFYHYRSEAALKVKPNAAHRALAELSLSSIRSRHAPNSTFTLITQNVDGLSVVALNDVISSNPSEPEEPQPRILEMHGRLFDVKCTSKRCGHIEFDRSSPICEGLRSVEELVDKNSMDPDISKSELPRCAKCNALARPGVVWFEEMPLYLDVINKLVDEADLCLVVGTSSTVYPAAGYAEAVSQNGGQVAVFNLDRSDGDEDANFLFLGPCEETVPKALGLNKG